MAHSSAFKRKRAKVCCEPYLASRRPVSDDVGFRVLELETNINLKGGRQCPEGVNQTGQVHIRGVVLNEARERARAALAGSYQSLWL